MSDVAETEEFPITREHARALIQAAFSKPEKRRVVRFVSIPPPEGFDWAVEDVPLGSGDDIWRAANLVQIPLACGGMQVSEPFVWDAPSAINRLVAAALSLGFRLDSRTETEAVLSKAVETT